MFVHDIIKISHKIEHLSIILMEVGEEGGGRGNFSTTDC